MPENHDDRDVKCPFYCKTLPNKIVCEGIVNGSTLHFTFTNDQDRRRYLIGVCSNLKGHRICPIYKMLYEICEENNNE